MTAIIDVGSLKHDYESGICLQPLAFKYNISPATAKKYLNSAGVDTGRKCFQKDTWELIQNINTVLDNYNTRLTVRQIFYQLASKQLVKLSKKGYGNVQSACAKGRKHGYIDWDRIEDRTRQPHTPLMFKNREDYKNTILNAYRKDIWQDQPNYFEVWLEKNALYGVLWPICNQYGVTLQIITGYSSISAIHAGVQRFREHDGEQPTILYFGDHDATGVDIDRSIVESFLNDHGMKININRIGLLYEDIVKYGLLPNIEKETDKRLKGYKSKGYTEQAELDALPPDVLVKRVEDAITNHLILNNYNKTRQEERKELNEIQTRLRDF